jgi:hypothetical protein
VGRGVGLPVAQVSPAGPSPPGQDAAPHGRTILTWRGRSGRLRCAAGTATGGGGWPSRSVGVRGVPGHRRLLPGFLGPEVLSRRRHERLHVAGVEPALPSWGGWVASASPGSRAGGPGRRRHGVRGVPGRRRLYLLPAPATYPTGGTFLFCQDRRIFPVELDTSEARDVGPVVGGPARPGRSVIRSAVSCRAELVP